jgi:hypothetical protein
VAQTEHLQVEPEVFAGLPTRSMPLRRTVAAARVLSGRTTAKISAMSWLGAQLANTRVVSPA